MNDEDDTEYQDIVQEKGKRSRRRELNSMREVGRLRAYFIATGQWWEMLLDRSVHRDLWRQLMHAHKHSCHCSCCVIDTYEKRHDNRVERREERARLRRLP